MAAFIWPSTLPQWDAAVLNGFAEPMGVVVQTIPTDSGFEKTAYIGARAKDFVFVAFYSDAQREALREFYEETIKGVARFEFERNGSTEEVSIIGDGTINPEKIARNLWRIALTMRVWP
jgi:hypothetical protein